MPFESSDGGRAATFAEYKRTHEGEHTPERLSHFFNSELGMASNVLHTLEAELQSANAVTAQESAIAERIREVIDHLTTVHEIGNICFDILLKEL